MEKEINHPLEEIFDIESGTTLSDNKSPMLTVGDTEVGAEPHPSYDTKDDEINTQLDAIKNTALDSYEAYMDTAETIDPQFKARVGEIASSFLGHALNAIKQKSTIKTAKDRLTTSSNTKGNTTTINSGSTYNVIAMDRDTMLKNLVDAEENRRESLNVIDGSTTEEE